MSTRLWSSLFPSFVKHWQPMGAAWGRYSSIREEDKYDLSGTKYTQFRVPSYDGLTIAGRYYGDRNSCQPTILCIPGITRNVRDFEPLINYLIHHKPGYRAIAVDLRGHGESGYDPNPNNYNPVTEAHDIIAVINAMQVHKPIVIGTSRGGIVAMVMASLHMNLFLGVILNDIGPVVEVNGLLKASKDFKEKWRFNRWDDVSNWLREKMQEDFPKLDQDAYERAARRMFRNCHGRPVPDCDPNLIGNLDLVTPTTVLPQLWSQFLSLYKCPVLVLRGENSKILSQKTVNTMRLTNPGLEAHTVIQQGHPPLLEDETTLKIISNFTDKCAKQAKNLWH